MALNVEAVILGFLAEGVFISVFLGGILICVDGIRRELRARNRFWRY